VKGTFLWGWSWRKTHLRVEVKLCVFVALQAQFYTTFTPDQEYQRIQRARQRLAQIRANVEGTAAQLEAQEMSMAMA
jgi:hypothetical protein